MSSFNSLLPEGEVAMVTMETTEVMYSSCLYFPLSKLFSLLILVKFDNEIKVLILLLKIMVAHPYFRQD